MEKGKHIKFKHQGTDFYGIAIGKISAVLVDDITVQTETPKKAKTITKDEFCQKIRDAYWELFTRAARINDNRSVLEMIRWNILEMRHDGIFQATTIPQEIRAMTEEIGTLHTTGRYLVAGHYGILIPQKPAYGFEKINIIDLTKMIGNPQLQKMEFKRNGRTEERIIDSRWIPTEENISILLSYLYPNGFGEITPEHNGIPMQSYYVRTVPTEGLRYIPDTTLVPELDEELKRLKEKLKKQAQQIMNGAIQL